MQGLSTRCDAKSKPCIWRLFLPQRASIFPKIHVIFRPLDFPWFEAVLEHLGQVVSFATCTIAIHCPQLLETFFSGSLHVGCGPHQHHESRRCYSLWVLETKQSRLGRWKQHCIKQFKSIWQMSTHHQFGFTWKIVKSYEVTQSWSLVCFFFCEARQQPQICRLGALDDSHAKLSSWDSCWWSMMQ